MIGQNSFAIWLKRQRKLRDLSREALAQRAHCSASTIRRLEAGDLRPSQSLAETLATTLGILPDEQEAFVRFARGDITSFPSATAQVPTANPYPPPYLPAPLTSFVGRKRDVTAVCQLLNQEGVRLLTLSGPPGIGKTRLSIAVASELAKTELFTDGVCFISLAPVSEERLVTSAVAEVLGVRETPASNKNDDSLHASVKAFLVPKRMLLVLDNFEQVTATAPYITDWLAAAAHVKVLVTSRERLHVYGEHNFPVTPLPLPDVTQLPPTLSSSFYTRYSALQLFKERARAAQFSFQLTLENITDVVQICTKLDGLPLAIEMAAAQVRWLPPRQILDQLHNCLAAFVDGPVDLSPRQQSLRGAIEWSYRLLSASQKRLFDTLGVFVGGCALEAIAAVTNQLEGIDESLWDSQTLRANLQSLVEKSLLGYEMTPAGEVRYKMLAILQEYAQQQLQAHERMEMARQAHATHYSQLAHTGNTQLTQGRDQIIWLKRLEQEHNNIRAALTWATENPDRAPFAQRLAQAMSDFWDTRGYIQEGRQWLETVLALDDTPSEIRGHLLNDVGWLARLQGDREAARAFQQQALAIQQAIGDINGMSRSLENLAILASSQGDLTQAGELLERSLAIRRKLGDPNRLSVTLNNLAIVLWQLREFDRAEALYLENEALSRTTQNTKILAQALHGRGTVYLSLGNYAAALTAFQEALPIRQELGDRSGLANTLGGVAETLFYQGNAVPAAQLMAAALKLQAELGKTSSPAAHLETEATIALMRAHLGEAAFAQAWGKGETILLDEAIALAVSR